MPSSFIPVTCGEGQKVTCSDCVGAGSLIVPCVSPKGKGKGKLAPAHAMKAYRVGGGYRYSSTESKGHTLKWCMESGGLTSRVLSLGVRSEWSTLHPGRLIHGKETRYSLNRWLSGP
jgi:hypothetical protein